MFQCDPDSPRWRRFFLRVLLYGGAIFVIIPALFAHLMTASHRSPITEPSSRYETLTLSSDGLALRAWLSRESSAASEPVEGSERAAKPSVILVHGLGDTLESYLSHAAPFVARGHRVLLLDLRAHGGSDGSLTTLGGKESEDVLSAIASLEDRGLANDGVILVGHSMGAVAVILAGARSESVRAVIAEAPYDSFRNTVQHHARILYGLPSWVPLIPIAIRLAEWRADFDADSIDCVASAMEMRAPLLAIVDGDDPRMPESVVKRIVDAHPGPSSLWIAEGVGHVGARLHPDWESQVFGFLAAHRLSALSP